MDEESRRQEAALKRQLWQAELAQQMAQQKAHKQQQEADSGEFYFGAQPSSHQVHFLSLVLKKMTK